MQFQCSACVLCKQMSFLVGMEVSQFETEDELIETNRVILNIKLIVNYYINP